LKKVANAANDATLNLHDNPNCDGLFNGCSGMRFGDGSAGDAVASLSMGVPGPKVPGLEKGVVKVGGELFGRETRSAGLREGAGSGGGQRRPDFIADEKGVVVPTSRRRLEGGFTAAGFESVLTSSPGREYVLPNGEKVRVMEPTPYAPTRATFTNANGGHISPFTGKPPQPPRAVEDTTGYVHSRTHVELGP
jgi:hypothetical protein